MKVKCNIVRVKTQQCSAFYTTILLGFLFRTVIIALIASESESFSSVSMDIFIKWERLDCPSRFRILVFISFICEKLLSTEVVPTGIDKRMFARVLMFRNMVLSISFVLSSVNREYKFPFGCLDKYLQNVFHFVRIPGDISASLVYSSPSVVSVGCSTP